MKLLLWAAIFVALVSGLCFSQVKFSDEAKKFIEYNDPIAVFKNALLIDGRGNPAMPRQTVIISGGKIVWIGDDAKAVIPNGAKIIDLSGNSLLPGFVMMHEHMYISAHSLDPRYI